MKQMTLLAQWRIADRKKAERNAEIERFRPARLALMEAVNDMVADRLLAPPFDKAWEYIWKRFEESRVSRQIRIQCKTGTRLNLWRLHEDLERKVGPAAQLQQWAYELERCA